MNFRYIYITGDTHGQFEWLPAWCEKHQTSTEDALIILGDAGIMYYGEKSSHEKRVKEKLAKLPITLLCVRGNHEARPIHYSTIKFIPWEDGGVYQEPAYPNILYIQDGSIFHLNDKKCLTIGGAFSVDKELRLLCGYTWFEDEELTNEEMAMIKGKIGTQSFDFVFTHTCPIEWEPTYLFLPAVSQAKVSKRMENFLQEIKESISFNRWFFGHFHDHRPDYNEKASLLFQKVERLL